LSRSGIILAHPRDVLDRNDRARHCDRGVLARKFVARGRVGSIGGVIVWRGVFYAAPDVRCSVRSPCGVIPVRGWIRGPHPAVAEEGVSWSAPGRVAYV